MSKIYGVYLAYSKHEVMSDEDCANPNVPEYPSEISRVRYYNNKMDQLECFSNTHCPASQLFEADTEEEAKNKVGELKRKFQDKAWLDENIRPYI